MHRVEDHKRQASNVSQKEQARRMIKKIPSKIKVIEGMQTRHQSVPKETQQPVFPITIRNAYEGDAYNFTNVRKEFAPGQPKQKVLISLEPPRIDVGFGDSGRTPRDSHLEYRLRQQQLHMMQ